VPQQIFATGDAFEKLSCPNHQLLDWVGLRGRVLSSSYAPEPNEAGHAALLRELRRVYDAHASDGCVRFE
jgi:hypothetical protein